MKKLLILTHLIVFLFSALIEQSIAQKVEGLKVFNGDFPYVSFIGGCYSLSTDTVGNSVLIDWYDETQNGFDPFNVVSIDNNLINNSFGNDYGVTGSYPNHYLPITTKVDKENNVYVSGIYCYSFTSTYYTPFLRKILPSNSIAWEMQTSCYATGITFDDSLNVFITGRNNALDMNYAGYFYTVAPSNICTKSTQKISNNGTVIWTDTINFGKTIEFANNKIFISDSITTCLSETDSLLWFSPLKGSISVFHNKLFINDSLFYCLDLTGNVLWNLPIAGLKHSTNFWGNSAIIYLNGTVSVIDSNGLFKWQKTGFPDLYDVALDSHNKVHVLGNVEIWQDWWLCPYFTGLALDGSGSDGYVAKIAYDTINEPVITTYFHTEVIEDFRWHGYQPYYCQGDVLENSNDCDYYRYGITYNYCGNFNTGNQFIELVDDNIAFTSPDTLINHKIPFSTPPGTNYYKVISTNPPAESNVFTFYVHPNPPPLLTPSGQTAFCLGGSVKVKSTYPYTGCSDLQWYLNGSQIWSGDSIIISSPGLYTAEYDAYYNASSYEGCQAIPPVSILVTQNIKCMVHHHSDDISRITSEDDRAIFKSINIYPNPFTENTKLYLGDTGTNIKIIVNTFDGRELKKISCSNCDQLSFGEDLARGVYYLTVESENNKSIFPIIKM